MSEDYSDMKAKIEELEGEVHGVGVSLDEEADAPVLFLDQVVFILEGVQNLHPFHTQGYCKRCVECRHFGTVDFTSAKQGKTRRKEDDKKRDPALRSPHSNEGVLGN